MDFQRQQKCAICGRSLDVSYEDYCQIAATMGLSVKDMQDIVPIICGPCASSEIYKTEFFGKKAPYIALNTPIV